MDLKSPEVLKTKLNLKVNYGRLGKYPWNKDKWLLGFES
jgi:hypothetical protein